MADPMADEMRRFTGSNEKKSFEAMNERWSEHERGFNVVAISDVAGGIYNASGLEIPGVLEYLHSTKSLERYPGGDHVSNDELLELDCDELAPCATENHITSGNANRIRCKTLAEGTNGPTTPAAHRFCLKTAFS